MMKSIVLLFVFVLSSSFVKHKDISVFDESSKWIITDNSSLSVNGSTNISKFSCKILQYQNADTVTVAKDKNDKIILTGALHITVLNFNCSNYMMTREMRKTLREDEYPYLHVKFLSLKEMASPSQKNNALCGVVEITIAGVSKRFQIFYQLSIAKNKINLVGNQPINFSDFNLSPPKKMGKLVRANDQLAVVFNLDLKLI